MSAGRVPNEGAIFSKGDAYIRRRDMRIPVRRGGLIELVARHSASLGTALALSFGLLRLAALAFVPVICLHVGLHGGHASRRISISAAGQAHVVVLMDVIIEGLVVGGPESTQRAEVGVHLAA